MVPGRPGQFLAARVRRRALLGSSLVALILGLALGGSVWFPLSLISLALGLGLWRATGDDGALDPTNDLKKLAGERQVATVLSSLAGVGVVAVHDVELGSGNVDHVAIGPTGVFAIETKNWAGRFFRRDGRLMHGGFAADGVVAQATRSACLVHDALLTTGLDVFVVPVLVSTRAHVIGQRFKVRQVEVAHVHRLSEVITRRTKQLDPAQIMDARAALLHGGDPIERRAVNG